MDTAPIIQSFQSLILDLPPSCLQFCRRYPRYFVIGTYNLQQERGERTDETEHEKRAQNRNGSLLLFYISDEHSPAL